MADSKSRIELSISEQLKIEKEIKTTLTLLENDALRINLPPGVHSLDACILRWKKAILTNPKIKEELFQNRYSIQQLLKEVDDFEFPRTSFFSTYIKVFDAGIHPNEMKNLIEFLSKSRQPYGEQSLFTLLSRGWPVSKIASISVWEADIIEQHNLDITDLRSLRIPCSSVHPHLLRKGFTLADIRDLNGQQLKLLSLSIQIDAVRKATLEDTSRIAELISWHLDRRTVGDFKQEKERIESLLPILKDFQWRALIKNRMPESDIFHPNFTLFHEAILNVYPWHDSGSELGTRHLTPAELQALAKCISWTKSTGEKLTVKDILSIQWTPLHTILVGKRPLKDIINLDVKNLVELGKIKDSIEVSKSLPLVSAEVKAGSEKIGVLDAKSKFEQTAQDTQAIGKGDAKLSADHPAFSTRERKSLSEKEFPTEGSLAPFFKRFRHHFPDFVAKISIYKNTEDLPEELAQEFIRTLEAVVTREGHIKVKIAETLQEYFFAMSPLRAVDPRGPVIPQAIYRGKHALLSNPRIQEDLITGVYSFQELLKEADELHYDDVLFWRLFPLTFQSGMHPRVLKQFREEFKLRGFCCIQERYLDQLLVKGFDCIQILSLTMDEASAILEFNLSIDDIKSTKLIFGKIHIELLEKGYLISDLKNLNDQQLNLLYAGFPITEIAQAPIESVICNPTKRGSQDLHNYLDYGISGQILHYARASEKLAEERRQQIIRLLPLLKDYQWRALIIHQLPEKIVCDPSFSPLHESLLTSFKWDDDGNGMGIKHLVHPWQLQALANSIPWALATGEKLTVKEVLSPTWTNLHTNVVGLLPLQYIVGKDVKELEEILVTPCRELMERMKLDVTHAVLGLTQADPMIPMILSPQGQGAIGAAASRDKGDSKSPPPSGHSHSAEKQQEKAKP